MMWVRICALLASLFASAVGDGMVYPCLATITTNAFARELSGRPIDCSMNNKTGAGAADGDADGAVCRMASRRSAEWSAWSSVVADAVLGTVSPPVIGCLSDRFGRWTFLMAGIGLEIAPLGALWLCTTEGVAIRAYYVASICAGCVHSLTLIITLLGDDLKGRPALHAACVSYVSVLFSVAMVVGSAIVDAWFVRVSGYMYIPVISCIFMKVVSIAPLAIAYFFCASDPRRSGGNSQDGDKDEEDPLIAPSSRHHGDPAPDGEADNREWVGLSLAVFCIGVMSSGTRSVADQYMQSQLGVSVNDAATIFIASQASGCLVKLVVVVALLRVLDARSVMSIGMAGYVMGFLLMGSARVPSDAVAATVVGSLAAMCWPAQSAIQLELSRDGRLGATNGFMQMLSSIATGLGSAAFTSMYVYAYADAPGALWYAAAAIGLFAIVGMRILM